MLTRISRPLAVGKDWTGLGPGAPDADLQSSRHAASLLARNGVGTRAAIAVGRERLLHWPGAAGHRARTCDRCPTNCRHSTPSGRGLSTARACTVAKAGRCHLRSGRRRREAFRRTEEPRRHPDAAGRQEPPDTAWIRAGRHRIPYSTRWRCLLLSEDQPTGNR